RTKVTMVAVPQVRDRIVTTPDGRLLRRVGSSCHPLVGESLARFVRSQEDRPGEDRALPVVDASEFDVHLVNRALASEGRRAVRRDGVLRALVDLGVATPPDPPAGVSVLAAAALLFAREPMNFVSGATVQAVRRTGVGPGPGPLQNRVELSGPLPEVLDSVLEFVDANTQRYQAVVGTHRETIAEYPPAVMREAVLNALAHRDYSLQGATVDLTVWDDRIEIRSPGSLPGHITIENMREE